MCECHSIPIMSLEMGSLFTYVFWLLQPKTPYSQEPRYISCERGCSHMPTWTFGIQKFLLELCVVHVVIFSIGAQNK